MLCGSVAFRLMPWVVGLFPTEFESCRTCLTWGGPSFTPVAAPRAPRRCQAHCSLNFQSSD
ncbi:unnamed protein product, partial [Musa banksii]